MSTYITFHFPRIVGAEVACLINGTIVKDIRGLVQIKFQSDSGYLRLVYYPADESTIPREIIGLSNRYTEITFDSKFGEVTKNEAKDDLGLKLSCRTFENSAGKEIVVDIGPMDSDSECSSDSD